MKRALPVALALMAGPAFAAAAVAQDPGAVPVARENLDQLWQMLSAEDARGGGERGVEPLLAGLGSDDPGIRRIAVRGLGRLERPGLVGTIASLLRDPDAGVRREAANAVAQAVWGSDGAAALEPLLERLRDERDDRVSAAVLAALGRLPLDAGPGLRRVETALVAALEGSVSVDAVRGLDAFVRNNRAGHPFADETVARLRSLTTHRDSSLAGTRVRAMAASALAATGRASVEDLSAALADPHAGVRRAAVAGLRVMQPSVGARGALLDALEDPSSQVRYEALQHYAGTIQGAGDCEAVMPLADDPDPHVALLAMDVAGRACTLPDSLVDAFARIAAAVRDADTPHRGVHALVALAYNAPERARALLPLFVSDPRWLVRLYAAEAAAIAGPVAELEHLALDGHANVRGAALEGLSALSGHEADYLYISALESDDYQLLMTATRALEGTPNPVVAAPALVAAFERVSAARRETSRDARRAILERLSGFELDPPLARRLGPHVRDFDPEIADLVARVLTSATAEPHVAAPEPLPAEPVPSVEELEQLARARVVVRMARGGEFTIRLFPWDAPTNAARFARLARTGYFDGLTFHRIAPNFVIQGGSPGANEYMGAGPFSRDELTRRGHWRGTVGLSTRGRDTGDAQIFVNLVDNLRLDHNYTIYGEVVDGMEVVDGVVEADVIEGIEVRQVRRGAARGSSFHERSRTP